MNYSNNHFVHHSVRRNSIINNSEDDGSSSLNSYPPQRLCPAGGIHDFENEWLFEDYLSACLCCPCYLFRECCCGNPFGDGYDGVGCRPTGPGTCSKCKQSEQQTKDSYALQQFQTHTGAGVHAPSPPRVPAPVQYDATRQMIQPGRNHDFDNQFQDHVMNPNGDERENMSQSQVRDPNGDSRNHLSNISYDQSRFPQIINYSQFQNNRVMSPNFDNRNYYHNNYN
ncbi:5364_t:CDS:2 [Funneliformis geosporum]|uniref:2832_t:CDS:1 n=1 Tax=Funneliformis geosporum TaxID=1117311 RepID=A0A9W4SBQ6_9GLOM|nr:2832_t:CDS:2 [Funneliformis geosporum]CAI2178986.1 5364_t:CDS:2 [Funneliformis geosporum]